MKMPHEKYISDDYIRQNPSWDSEDSPWKVEFIAAVLRTANLMPDSICEVGCGAGGVLAGLRCMYPHTELYGYDIAPAVAQFWKKHEQSNIRFYVGDFFCLNKKTYDLILLLDVIEHVVDPFNFLSQLNGSAKWYLFHFPLDLSAINVLREKPILSVRKNVGHIHYFTKNLALSLLKECGYDIIEWRYTGATFNVPRRTWRTMLASLPRRLAYAVHKDWGVRALGGETLFVLARDQNDINKEE
ncbi:MAG: bifunctional 3-demethylubiquinone-9 3-methyltransferase/ 2-octaprenyl-6-hydroxy phenol methylase [Pelotomaculum sp. PtaB.Bin104]|nr:MAG: bifunctional 3-demethylubiquinone-9 3-methyltransferase/ 2-octaprenyl-6-hydroxy phenol methylase [Pelotomaculum sp. PtaB.Bin104]